MTLVNGQVILPVQFEVSQLLPQSLIRKLANPVLLVNTDAGILLTRLRNRFIV